MQPVVALLRRGIEVGGGRLAKGLRQGISPDEFHCGTPEMAGHVIGSGPL